MTRREAIDRYHALRNGPILEMAAMSPDEILGPLLAPLTVADAMEVPEVRALIDAVNKPAGYRPACVQQGRIIEAAHALAAKVAP
jgi:hypothetical protein